MNVRFSEAAIRIRLSHGEFGALSAGRALRLDLPVGAAACAVRLHADARFAVTADEGGLSIAFPAEALASLAGGLPSRDGLEYAAELAGRPCTIALEVDVRSSRAARVDPPPAR